VRLEIAADPHAPITSQQEWLQKLSAAGVTNLRIRAGQDGDKVGVDVQGSEAEPIYLVTGIITPGNQLVIPGGRFRSSDAHQIARWLDDLGQKGLKSNDEPRSTFGLTEKQLKQAREDLAQPVGFATLGLARSQAVAKVAERWEGKFRIPPGLLEADPEDTVAEALASVSCGTALACLLRPAGLGLVPRSGPGGEVQYTVSAAKADTEFWPLGWPPDKPLPKAFPAMYESFNANVQDIPLAKVLDVLAKRLKVPFLLDHNALARHGIEPNKKKVNAPQSRTTYNQLLRKILSQAGLKGEVRLDEAGKPLVWITSVKPI
jgi:hypothetical protein